MNDQLDDPANSPSNGEEPEHTPESTAESAQVGPAAATSTGSEAPAAGAGGPAGPQRRLVKKRTLAPGRRPAGVAPRPRPARPASATPRHATPAQSFQPSADEDEGFFIKHRTKFVVGIVALLGGGLFYVFHSSSPSSAPAKTSATISVRPLPPLPPPPPPPPPPPKREPPPQKEDKMEAAPAPAEKKAEAPKQEAPKQDLGTGIKGNGPGMSGLGGTGEGGGIGGNGNGGGGSEKAAFTYQVKNKVAAALHQNDRTKKASFNVRVRLWADPSGNITRCTLESKTNDPELDKAIQNALTNIQLGVKVPDGVRMPIVMNLGASRSR